jgi:ABC-type lipoprotein release transport system permease subunit
VNPLSPFTYYRRHKVQALLLLVLIGSLTLGVFVLVGVMTSAVEGIYHTAYLSRVSRILAGEALPPGTVAQLRAHPDVAAVLPENGLTINLPLWSGGSLRPVLGATGDDLELVMETCNLRLKEGRLIEPRAAEIILSEEIVRVLGLQIGDVIGHEIDEDVYPTIATELTLVGVLEGVPSEAGPGVQAGFVSYEYLEGHEAYQPRLSNLLIIPRPGRRVAVSDFARALVDGSQTTASLHLETFEGERAHLDRQGEIVNGMSIFVGGVVAVSAALVMGMVNRIAIARRLPELGLLHAAGHDRRCLVRRLVLEIAVITGIGWASGLLLSVTASALLNATLVTGEPVIEPASATPFLFTLPIPLAVVSWVTVSIYRVLNRLDAVAIIERGNLSMEEGRRSSGRSRATTTSRNPLSSWTFYRRHRWRSLALLVATGLMVLGVAFPPFISNMLIEPLWPVILSYASHASIVSPAPSYQAVDPAVLAQIRAHPAVSHVIPVKGAQAAAAMPGSGLNMVTETGPFEMWLPVYGGREGDLQTLLDVYDLHLSEGTLPQPRSGQVVLTRALARNRGLSVGDTVGRPVHERDSIPTELTVVGLLDSPAPRLAEREGYPVPDAPRWVAFASYEFVESHELYSTVPTYGLVIPVEGREAEVETWLEESISSPQVTVTTFGTVYRYMSRSLTEGMLILAITESVLAVVAALALAILNRIFVSQRQDEFGILHAVGHGRAALIARTVRENVGIAAAAWLIGAACCLALLLSAQALVYVPRGMSLDLTNVTPWLFTLPIPLAVVAASAGTIAWALSQLDPVAVIERR